MRENPIGIFDSGVGGLSVLRELIRIMPNENYLYFGDTERIPYGEKTKEQLFGYVRGIMEWFKTQNVKAVIMACNTSSAVVYEAIKDDYDFPIFSLIEPTADYISFVNTDNIGVMATSATVKSKAYTKSVQKISPLKNVFEIACPGLVEIVESNKIDTNEAKKLVIKYVMPLLEKGSEKIILGCTHYPFLKELINDITGDKELLIDPAIHLAEKVADKLLTLDLLKTEETGTNKFFASSNTSMFMEAGKKLYPDIYEVIELKIGEVTSVIK